MTWGDFFSAWPVILSILACGGLLVRTQVSLTYLARDVKEMRADLKTLATSTGDCFPRSEHEAFVAREISPLRERVRKMGERMAKLEP